MRPHAQAEVLALWSQGVAHFLSLERRRKRVCERESSDRDKSTVAFEAADIVLHLIMPSFQNPGNWQPRPK